MNLRLMNRLSIKKSRILFLTSVFRVGYGVGLVIRKQAEYLLRQGFTDIHIGSPDLVDIPDLPERIRVHSVGTMTDDFETYMRQLQPDIIIAHTPPFFQLVGAYSDKPCYKIAYDHGEPFPDLFPDELKDRQAIEQSKQQALRHFNRHISISNFIVQHSGVTNSEVIYNGVDHIHQTALGTKTENLATWLGYPAHTKIVAGLSRIGVGERHYKGYDLFIAFKRAIEAALPSESLAFVFMGRSVPPGNEVEDLLVQAGIKLLENVPEDDKRRVLQNCDLFLSTSLWEGFNLPLTEAQYLGAPSVAFSIGAHPEVCPNHFTSLDELTFFARRVLSDAAFRQKTATQGQRFVQQQFTWERNGQRLVEVLEQIQGGKDRVILQTEAFRGKMYERALERDLERRGVRGRVMTNPKTGFPCIRYQLPEPGPLVSIIIPNHNHLEDLQTCMQSILNQSSYPHYEIIIAENGSTDPELLSYYEELKDHPQVRICIWEKPFNYAAVNNFAVTQARGEVLVFLNNDTEVISPDWLERMLEYAMQPAIGAVGAKLLFPDNTVQHGGIVIGINGVAANMDTGKIDSDPGYQDRLLAVQNMSAVTAACLMCRKEVFDAIKGFDEGFVIALNDVDLCLRIREAGYRIVWTPHAELYHHEMKTRGQDLEGEKAKRFKVEIDRFVGRWERIIEKGDMYYHGSLSRTNNNYILKL